MIVGLSWEGQGHLKTLWTLCLGQTNPRSRHTAGVTPQAGVLLAGEWWALVACLVTQVRCGGAPGQHLAPSGRGVSHPSPCVSSWGCPHTSPGVFNGPRLGRMKGTIQRRFTIDTSIVLKYASRVTFDPPQLSLHFYSNLWEERTFWHRVFFYWINTLQKIRVKQMLWVKFKDHLQLYVINVRPRRSVQGKKNWRIQWTDQVWGIESIHGRWIIWIELSMLLLLDTYLTVIIIFLQDDLNDYLWNIKLWKLFPNQVEWRP